MKTRRILLYDACRQKRETTTQFTYEPACRLPPTLQPLVHHYAPLRLIPNHCEPSNTPEQPRPRLLEIQSIHGVNQNGAIAAHFTRVLIPTTRGIHEQTAEFLRTRRAKQRHHRPLPCIPITQLPHILLDEPAWGIGIHELSSTTAPSSRCEATGSPTVLAGHTGKAVPSTKP